MTGHYGDLSPAEGHLRAALESVVPGVRVSGIVPNGAVDIVSAVFQGSNFLIVTYRDHNGRTEQAVLKRDDEARLTVEVPGRTRPFDGDAEAWRLAAESLRIRYAALFDPMLAITTSDIQPLPHQIRAVYGELLPRTPLRFLLADDPGAGKTIMCGLYIKELLLRGDLDRCLIVAPGSLVDQWLDELYDKFGLRFELLTKAMVDAEVDANPFERHPLLIARMDQLSRSDDLRLKLERSDWDLVVVDEAHRMSAQYAGGDVKKTRRYQLGELLGRVARHLLLMTATPHAGKQEDFQLFLALLDADRFEGRYRDGVHTVAPQDLMRRMVKEDLLTMEGKPLFPQRRAYTVPYQLSHDEADLYEAVTLYVREEMNRAERLKAEGEGRRGNTVGFALTVLQRRLASSPEAILKSLERRKSRLERRKREMQGLPGSTTFQQKMNDLLDRESDDLDDGLDELNSEEIENLEEEVVDAATAARTVQELEHEIGSLTDLIELAQRVRHSGRDVKWSELNTIISDSDLTRDPQGNLRKIIIFTEHRDTLNYLLDRIRTLIGSHDAVVSIHGGVGREQRRAIQELFTQDPKVRVLVATDAAGEGLNLQRAHLMVNYDLPWNPNRIEQRFGRIHRIGQLEVCHLWNLVAENTREGQVFARLLEKLEEQRKAYGGKVFDVLGDSFADRSLRSLLMEAIRDGDRPEVRERLNTVIDATVGQGLDALLAERALMHDVIVQADFEAMRVRLEEAQARRLQPHYIEAFFVEAFTRLGGRVSRREPGRYEVTQVPQLVRDQDRLSGTRAPVLTRYERITFERGRTRLPGLPSADLIAPGHPLLDAVVEVTVTQHRLMLKQGAVFLDTHDQGEVPRLLIAVTEEIANGRRPPLTIEKRFDFVELDREGRARDAGPAPYLDYERVPTDAAVGVARVLDEPWLARGVENIATGWAIENSLPRLESTVRSRVTSSVSRTRDAVRQRLLGEINFWDAQVSLLQDQEAAGKKLKIRPETAFRRARALEDRLARRIAELAEDEHLTVRPPLVAGGALVIPQGLLERLTGQRVAPTATYVTATQFVERRAIAAVLNAEVALGRRPTELAHNHPGYDIRSVAPDDSLVQVEVKGRIAGANEFTITRNEVLTARNLGDSYRLALVIVSDAGPGHDQVRYLRRPFDDMPTGDFTVRKFVLDFHALWDRGSRPQ